MYRTIYDPQVQYTTDTVSLIAAAPSAAFFVFWTVKRNRARRRLGAAPRDVPVIRDPEL